MTTADRIEISRKETADPSTGRYWSSAGHICVVADTDADAASHRREEGKKQKEVQFEKEGKEEVKEGVRGDEEETEERRLAVPTSKKKRSVIEALMGGKDRGGKKKRRKT